MKITIRPSKLNGCRFAVCLSFSDGNEFQVHTEKYTKAAAFRKFFVTPDFTVKNFYNLYAKAKESNGVYAITV